MDSISGVLTLAGGIGGGVLLLTPGYVLSRILSRGVIGPELGERSFLASIASGSIAVHVIALPWTVPLARNEFQRFPNLDAVDYLSLVTWMSVVLFLLPAFLGAAVAHAVDTTWTPVGAVLGWLGISRVQRTADAWTWVFADLSRRKEARWLQVRLRDGRAYLAAFGSNSLVSSDSRLRDMYLEETWDLDFDGQPHESNTPNTGVWISGEEIVSVEFYPMPRNGTEGRRSSGTPRT